MIRESGFFLTVLHVFFFTWLFITTPLFTIKYGYVVDVVIKSIVSLIVIEECAVTYQYNFRRDRSRRFVERFFNRGDDGNAHDYSSVSYTHLDVYKRQP